MKKTIYKYFFNEFVMYFTVTLFALAAVVWTIQAVNYLDLITEDGHAFTTYIYYSLLQIDFINRLSGSKSSSFAVISLGREKEGENIGNFFIY